MDVGEIEPTPRARVGYQVAAAWFQVLTEETAENGNLHVELKLWRESLPKEVCRSEVDAALVARSASIDAVNALRAGRAT